MVKLFGRETELQTLYQNLQQYDQVAITAVEGMGGVGKTHLAIEYAHLHLQLKTYPGGICWLRAREEDINIETQILQFATTKLGLKPPENWDTIQQIEYCWLNWRPDGDVLIVLDDVTNYPNLEPYLPLRLPRFKSLITTRLQLDLPLSIPLNILHESSALELLKFWVGEKVTQELQTAKELCEFLGYLPLALNLVGRYIKKRNISLAEMLRRLEREKISHQALTKDEKDRTWTLNVKLGVIAAFELSWSELSDDAKQLAVLLSLFALAPIPWSLVEKVETGKDAEQLEDIRVELENLHLLQSKENYELHPLIRQFFQLKQNEINEIEKLNRAFCQAMVEVAKEIPKRPNREDIKTFSSAILHLTEIAKNFITSIYDENLIVLFDGLGNFYERQGFYHQAETWRKQCVEVSKELLGEEHLDFATSLNDLALLYRFQGRYKEAELLYLKSLKLTNGKSSHHFAQILNNLGVVYRYQQEYNKAESYFNQALLLWTTLVGEEHPDFVQSLNNLALLYKYQKRYSEAEILYQGALELNRRLLGEEHPELAQILNNLATLYQSQERYSKAETLHLQALEMRKRLLGKDHPDFAQSLNNLAGIYYYQGRYSEAEVLLKQAVNIGEKVLGVNHPYTLASRENLHICQQALDNLPNQ